MDCELDDDIAESQRFIPKEDDEETLWEVVAITGERPKQYKVRWKGIDPKTMKPWPQNWVPKHDCTDDLVLAWKKSQRRKSTAKRESVASGSKSTRRSASTHTPKKRVRSSLKNEILDEQEPEAKAPTKKRTRSSGSNLPEPAPKSPKKKKSKQAEKAREVEESSGDEQEQERHVAKPKPSGYSKPKGKKRKLDEATSAHNSAKDDPTNDERQPRKKRKVVVVQVVKQESESEGPMMDFENDAAEEGLVGQALSQLDVDENDVLPLKSPRKRKSAVVQSRSPSAVPLHRIPTEEPSPFWDVEGRHKPILSPNAQVVLEQFDKEVLGLKKKRASESSNINGPALQFIPNMQSPLMRKSPQKTQTAVQAVASGSKLAVTSGNTVVADDYEEIIPETDESQELQITTATTSTDIPIHTRGVSKTKERPLHPIPRLSPSVFKPHLPKPPQPSLPESITNISDDSIARKLASLKRPGSPIEQFDSPARASPRPALVLRAEMGANGKGKSRMFDADILRLQQKERASDIWESKTVQDGQKMAEGAKQRRISESRPISPVVRPRKTVDDIIAEARLRANARAKGVLVDSDESVNSDDSDEDSDAEEPEGEGEYQPDAAGTSTVAIPPASGPHMLTLPDGFDDDFEADDVPLSLTLEQMESAYMDLSGGVVDPAPEVDAGDVQSQTQTQDDDTMNIDGPRLPVDPLMLREEEEESTQDVMMHFQDISRPTAPAAATSSKLPPVVEDERSAARISSDDESDPNLQLPKITIHPASRDASVFSNASRMTRSRSRSNTPAPPKGSAPPRKRGVTPIVAPSLPPVIEDTSELADAKTLIASLQAELAAARQRNTTLESSNVTLRSQISSLNASLIDKQAWATREIAEAESTWMTQKDEFDSALLQAEAAKAEAEKKQASAEKDREFFREQYAKASGFVSQVRDENKDLLKRIAIAEGQTEKGVALVRATFDQRVQTLEADVKSWRRMAEFLMEKDRRSNNDEMCRRAALGTELAAKCHRLKADINSYKQRLAESESLAEEKSNALLKAEADVEVYKAHVARLHGELDHLTSRLERGGFVGQSQSQSQDTSGTDGAEMVYRCDYRPGNQRRQCDEAFATLSELQEHVVGPHGHIKI